MVAVFLFKAAMPTSWPLPSVIATMKFAPDVSRDIGDGDGAISRIAQE